MLPSCACPLRRPGAAVALALVLAAVSACGATSQTSPSASADTASRIVPAVDTTVDTVVATPPGPRRSSARRSGSERPAPERSAPRLVPRPWAFHRPATGGQVEGYVDRPGAPSGTVVGLRVSTADPAYRVQAVRIGGHGGAGVLVWRSGRLPGERQAAPHFSDPATRTVVAGWHDSVQVDTAGWQPGVYLFRMTSSSGWQAAAPYVVTSRSVRGRVVLVVPVTTWQAYNQWGGYSLYAGPAGDRRAWRVSFDRPYDAPGFGELGFTAAPVAVQAEATGVPLAYLTNLDLDADPHALDGAAGYVSVGHDEYWTPGMRATVEQARAAGTNLAFLGANTSYWRIRLTPGGAGRPGDVIGYRSDAYLDPVTAPTLRTTRWRDGSTPEPEQRLVGAAYECYPVDAPFRVVTPGWWGFRKTGVRRGSTFAHLVGNEADRVYPGPDTPRPLQVLGDVDYTCRGVPTSAQATYYAASSGAGVVATGTLRWTCALTGNCFGLQMDPRTTWFVRRVTRTVVQQFARGPVGERFPAHDNVGRFHLPSVNQVSAS